MGHFIHQISDVQICFILATLATLGFLLRLVFMMRMHSPARTAGTIPFRRVGFLALLAFLMGGGWAALTARLMWQWPPVAAYLFASAIGLMFFLAAGGLTALINHLSRPPLGPRPPD